MYCKGGQLTLIDSEAGLKTYTCNNCRNLTQLERVDGAWQVIVNGVAVAGGIVAVLEFLDIDYEDFVDLFDLS